MLSIKRHHAFSSSGIITISTWVTISTRTLLALGWLLRATAECFIKGCEGGF
jgi:hypothetical protein